LYRQIPFCVVLCRRSLSFMSNQGPQINRKNSEPELSKLEAPQTPAPENNDLSQLSTKQSEMKIERPTKIDQEIARVRPLSLSNSVTHSTSPQTERKISRAERTPPSNAPRGILKNPYYRYSGGPFMRILTFIANLLKSFEQWLLRSIDKLFGRRTQKVVLPKAESKAEFSPTSKLEKKREGIQNSVRWSGGDS